MTEAEAHAHDSRLIEPGPGSMQATLEVLREFAVTRLAKMRDLISHPESIDLAWAVLAEHFGTFMLEPAIHEGEPVYLAYGKVDFFGDEAMARTVVPGEMDRTSAGSLRVVGRGLTGFCDVGFKEVAKLSQFPTWIRFPSPAP